MPWPHAFSMWSNKSWKWTIVINPLHISCIPCIETIINSILYINGFFNSKWDHFANYCSWFPNEMFFCCFFFIDVGVFSQKWHLCLVSSSFCISSLIKLLQSFITSNYLTWPKRALVHFHSTSPKWHSASKWKRQHTLLSDHYTLSYGYSKGPFYQKIQLHEWSMLLLEDLPWLLRAEIKTWFYAEWIVNV